MSDGIRTSSVKRLMEIVGYVSTGLGVIKGLNEFSHGGSIDDFLYQIGNTACAVVAVALLIAGLGIWLSALLGLGELIDRIPTPLVIIICILVGVYWSFQKGYSVERPYAIGIGAIIVIVTAYLGYQHFTDQRKDT
jgi:NhaP-type Na+/H+ or K+/H+ antiporter